MIRKVAFWASLVLIFIIPWEDSVKISSIGSLARLIGFGVAGLWVLTIVSEGRIRKFHLFHAFVLLFFLINIVSYLWSANIDRTYARVITYAQLFPLVLIFWELYQTPSDLKAALQAYILGGFVAIGDTILNYINGVSSVSYEARYTATGVNAVDLVVLLLLGLPLAWHLFVTTDKKKLIQKIINLAYIPLAIFAALLTGSRTSLFAVIPAIIFIFWPKRINIGKLLQSFIILIVLLWAILTLMPASVLTRLATAFSSISAGDLGSRVPLWYAAISLFLAHPILGYGSGTLYLTIGTAAHNILLSILAETGLVGFIIFLIILVIVFNEAVRLSKSYSGVWVAIFFVFMIGTSLLSWETKKATWLFLSFPIIAGNLIRDPTQPPKAELGSGEEKIQKSLDNKGSEDR
jgi:O-antigen ligase